MEKKYTNSDSLINFDFITTPKSGILYNENFELLFIVNGQITITVEEETYHLKPGDIILINTYRNHSYSNQDKDLLIVRFLLSNLKIKNLLGKPSISFWCNSTIDNPKKYEDLTISIIEILQLTTEDSIDSMYLNELYYKMLNILINDFLLTPENVRYESEKNKNDIRMQEIYSYILSKFKQNITLQDLSSKLYLSPNYLSKYIKRNTKINFLELLTMVRLSYAIEDLIHTNDSIMKIAMNNGFASIASFNKAFKQTYKVTPSDFRKKKQLEESKNILGKNDSINLIKKRLKIYLDNISKKEKEMKTITLTTSQNRTIDKPWVNNYCSIINIGTAINLITANIQKQILDTKNIIKFKYVRFNNIFVTDLGIDMVSKKNRNFGQLNNVIDFLIENQLKPYIEIGNNSNEAILDENLKKTKKRSFTSQLQMLEFYNDMIVHFLNRYGAREVETWYFEYLHKSKGDNEVAYLEEFNNIAKILRTHLHNINIGGGGFNLRYYSRTKLKETLTLWKGYDQLPSFITVVCFPDECGINQSNHQNKKANLNVISQDLDIIRSVLKEIRFPETEVHVPEYNLTTSNKNILNDHYLKAAFLIQDVIASYNKVDMLGFSILSDASVDFYNTNKILFGGSGLITKFGIAKPSFHALTLLNYLYSGIAIVNKNCLVTKSRRNEYSILSHNYKNINNNYLNMLKEITQQNIELVLENQDILRINLKFKDINNGIYLITKKYINKESGNIQAEWKNLNFEENISLQWIDYLKNISTPRMNVHEVTIVDNILEVDITLEPNEVQHLQIMYKGENDNNT